MKIRYSEERGHAAHGWLDSHHTFSFAGYHDPQWMGFRSLRVINDDIVMPGMGFGTHPHRDMEIITYVLSGKLEHRDSMGNGRVMGAGDLQYMAAGSGVEHSEFNPSKEEASHFLQIWIRPSRRGATPRYCEKSFRSAEAGRWHLAASPDGRQDSIAINQDAELLLAKLDRGQAVDYQIAAGRYGWLHMAEGEAILNGERLRAGDAAALDAGEGIALAAGTPSQVLLFNLN